MSEARVILRTDDRFHSSYDGIESWHCFSTGAHYDPDNVAHGALIGCDEHVLAPGAGFDWHAHRGVDIVSWVVAGALRHEDDRGTDRVVHPGEVFTQSAVAGIRHREANASPTAPLRLVQMTLLPSEQAQFEVWESSAAVSSPLWHLFAGAGEWQLGAESLHGGDSARGAGELSVVGSGQLLVWKL